MMNKRDKWDDAIREKLENYEARIEPTDWEAIANRLPSQPVKRLHFYPWRYAAAILLASLLVGGGFWLKDRSNQEILVADAPMEIQHPMDSRHNEVNVPSDKSSLTKTPSAVKSNSRAPQHAVLNESFAEHAKEQERIHDIENAEQHSATQINPILAEKAEIVEMKSNQSHKNEYAFREKHPLLAETAPRASKRVSQRRWGFGLGGGSYSVNSNSGVSNNFAFSDAFNSSMSGSGAPDTNLPVYPNNTVEQAQKPDVFRQETLKKTDVSHKRPISFGLGVSYMLNDRWALQSGLTYTYMISTWRTESIYSGKVKQRLHFIGIPLNINYKIAEWQHIQFYTGAGGMAEWNVAGRQKTDYYNGNAHVTTVKGSVRMEQPQWSVNGRVGASYPLFRYVSIYAEGGANYYFDNGSSVETIRSDKPFYVSLQAGFRLGF